MESPLCALEKHVEVLGSKYHGIRKGKPGRNERKESLIPVPFASSLPLNPYWNKLPPLPTNNTPEEMVAWLEGIRPLAVHADISNQASAFVDIAYLKIKTRVLKHHPNYKVPEKNSAQVFLTSAIKAYHNSVFLYHHYRFELEVFPLHHIRYDDHFWIQGFRSVLEGLAEDILYISKLHSLELLNQLYLKWPSEPSALRQLPNVPASEFHSAARIIVLDTLKDFTVQWYRNSKPR